MGESTPDNQGNVTYSITKRSDNFQEFDLRAAQISFLTAATISTFPEFDIAILEVDPNRDQNIANLLDIANSPALQLDFEAHSRIFGGAVEWLSTAATADSALTPRFFRGNLISNYTSAQSYKYIDRGGLEQT